MTERFDVFLSYSRRDAQEWTRVLAENLERLGIRVWWDGWELKPGDVLLHELDRGLQDRMSGIVVVSPEALASHWVQQEYTALMQRAAEGRRRVVPVLYADAEAPPLLASRVWVDFRGAEGPAYEAKVRELADLLRDARSSPTPRSDDLAPLVDDLLPLVRKVYPAWENFQNSRFLTEERQYKMEAAILAAELLGRHELEHLLAAGDHQEVLDRVRRVARATNLLYLSTPSTGDLAPIERDELTLAERTELIFDLLHGSGSAADRLERYRDRLALVNLPARWPFPTYLLSLLSPREEVFLKPTIVRWLFDKLGVVPWLAASAGDHPELAENQGNQTTINSEMYMGVRSLYHAIGEELARRHFAPQDMFDVQGFVWFAYFGEHEKTPPPEPETDAQPERSSAPVPVHHDAPAAVDELERRPFAEILARRIRQSFRSAEAIKEPSAFAVHLHGPWGSGKTSVLNFLEEELWKGEHAWIVVRFDAWKHQRIRPPWWPLIRAVYEQAQKQLPAKAQWKPRWTRWRWRMRTSVLPIVLTLITIALAILLIYLLVDTADRFALRDAVTLLVTVLGLGGTVFTLHRSLLFGSAKSAQAHLELQSDPLDPFSKLFERLIRAFNRPVAIFIDDLDRCDADAVVDLLEGIQTLFRQVLVVYVVAADREWIRTSFERRYASFVGNVGEPGRPLGHLFLEKMFQISVRVPRLSEETRLGYWQRLIATGEVRSAEETQELLVERGAQLLGNAMSPDDIQRVVEQQKGKPVEAAVRIAAAQKLSTPEAVAEAEHFLEPYAPLLEPNPRAMKRLVNAFGLHQAVNLLSHIDVQPEALAAWTIVEQRWPQLANLLSEQPDLLPVLVEGQAPDAARVPESLRSLFGSSSVQCVLSGVDERAGLDKESLRRLVGEPR